MRNFWRLLRLAKKSWKYMLLGLFGLIVSTAAELYTPRVFRTLIALIGEQPADMLQRTLFLAVILLIAYFLQGVCTGLKNYYLHKGAWHYLAELRVTLFYKLEHLSIRYFTNKQTGQLLSRIISDTNALEVLLAHAGPEILINLIMFISVLVILLTIHVKMALISLIVMPFIAVLVWNFSKKVRPIFKQSHQKVAELSAVLQDDLSGMKEIQSFNQQEKERERVLSYSMAHYDNQMRAFRRSAVYHPSIQFINNFGSVLVVAIGGYFAYQGSMSAADIVGFILYISMLYRPINTMGRLNEDLQNALAAAERVFEVLDTESEVKDKENAAVMPRAQGKINFEHVSFGYNQKEVLHDITVEVLPGETLALVGPTGVGKTTFISLLSRFYDVTGGSIRVDDTDIRDVTQKSLRDNISMVLQDVFLFNGTIAENIAYGVERATQEEIIRAAKIANAHEFIMETENGYETLIGERGVRLSGGQKQRISIARAVLRNTPILILDEATASVDTATEKLIQKAIDEIISDRTTVIIAHRLSTVRNADKIAVLDEGKIAEFGTHEALMQKNGLYATLCKIQMTNDEKEHVL